MSIRNLYVRAIRGIMRNHGVKEAKKPPSSSVHPKASFADVLRYTDWYATDRGSAAKRGNKKEHYRFDRYYNAINKALISRAKQWAHIDVGCGAGVFSWAFLDWAAQRGIERSNITLYGYDACPEMIRLARKLRQKMRPRISGYPDLHYYATSRAFIPQLTDHRMDADCLITFGYVLAANHDDKDIRTYKQIALAVLDGAAPGKKVYLLSSDSVGWAADQANEGWRKLLAALRASGVKARRPRSIGYSGDPCVLLSR